MREHEAFLNTLPSFERLPVEIGISRALELVQLGEADFHQEIGQIAHNFGPDRTAEIKQLGDFLVALRAKFASGELPVDKTQAVLAHVSRIEDYLREKLSVCRFAPKVAIHGIDLSSCLDRDRFIDSIVHHIPAFESDEKWLKSMIIRVNPSLFSNKETADAHNTNEVKAMKMARWTKAAFARYSNPDLNVGRYLADLETSMANIPEPSRSELYIFLGARLEANNPDSKDEFFQERDNPEKVRDLQIIFMGPMYEQEDARYAPEPIFFINFYADINVGLSQSMDPDAIMESIGSQQIKRDLVRNHVSFDDNMNGNQLVALAQRNGMVLPYYFSPDVVYRNPYRFLSDTQIEAHLKTLQTTTPNT